MVQFPTKGKMVRALRIKRLEKVILLNKIFDGNIQKNEFSLGKHGKNGAKSGAKSVAKTVANFKQEQLKNP